MNRMPSKISICLIIVITIVIIIIIIIITIINEINLSTDNISENSTSTEKGKQIKAQGKTKTINELKEGWKDKPLHGKSLSRPSDPDVNFSLTHQWLASSGLKSETEGFTIAAQDQSLRTRNFQANILENGSDPKIQSM